MRRKLVGTVAAGLAVSVLGFTTPVHADDTQVIIDNIPAAVNELVDGVQGTVDAFIATQSAVAASEALGQGLVATGTALVTGTEQFGALGLGLLLVNSSLQQGLAPLLGAIDDPSTAGDILTAEDVEILQANLQPALDLIIENAKIAVAEGLKGNLVAPGFLDPVTGTPALLGNTLAIVGDLMTGGAVLILTQGTSLQGLGTTVPILVLVGGAAAGGFLGDTLQQLEDAVTPVADGLAPLTSPIIALLEG